MFYFVEHAESKNVARKQFPSVHRWYSFMESHSCVQECLRNLPANIQNEISKKVEQVASESTSAEKRDEGKFIELPGAEIGKVVVRFPPEASGYGHFVIFMERILEKKCGQQDDGNVNLLCEWTGLNTSRNLLETSWCLKIIFSGVRKFF